MKGFTLIEIMVVISIIIVILTIAVSGFVYFKNNSDLNNNVQNVISSLKTAQNKTLASENYTRYGVYLNTASVPNQYVIFQGNTYALRTPSEDKIYNLEDSIEFHNVNLGLGSEIVFDRLTGVSSIEGSFGLRSKLDVSKNKTIYVASSGSVGFSAPLEEDILDADRVKDSRHVQFNYNRTIATATESIQLTFNDIQTVLIPINLFLISGELQWSDTISVGGSNQTVEISTVGLGTSQAVFNIIRDRRYNDKSLKVEIIEDSSGYLALYSGDGVTTSHTSIYVSDFVWE